MYIVTKRERWNVAVHSSLLRYQAVSILRLWLKPLINCLASYVTLLLHKRIILLYIQTLNKLLSSCFHLLMIKKKTRGTHQFSFQWPYFFTVLLFFCLEGFVLLVGNLWISGVKVVSGSLSMPKSRVLASTNFLVDTGFSLETASIRENIQNCFKNKCIWWWCISCNFLP